MLTQVEEHAAGHFPANKSIIFRDLSLNMAIVLVQVRHLYPSDTIEVRIAGSNRS